MPHWGIGLVKHGILYARDPEETPTEETFVIDGVFGNKEFGNQSLNGDDTLNVKVESDTVEVWLRGYMILLNESTGNEEMYNTNIAHGNYESINSNMH